MNAEQILQGLSTVLNNSFATATNASTIVITTIVSLDGRLPLGYAKSADGEIMRRIQLPYSDRESRVRVGSLHHDDVTEAGDYLVRHTDKVVLRLSDAKHTVMSNDITYITTIMISNAG